VTHRGEDGKPRVEELQRRPCIVTLGSFGRIAPRAAPALAAAR